MNSILKSLLATCALVQVAFAVYPVAAPQSPSLASLFFSSSLASQDPAISMGCFAGYIVQSKVASETYSNDYNQCLLVAKNERQEIDIEMEIKRISIAETAQGVCKRLSSCGQRNSTLSFFNCHGNTGANNTKDLYSLSGSAAEYATIMKEEYRISDFHLEKCCKDAERVYVESTSATYRTLQQCLNGKIRPTPPSTAAPSTAAPSTTTTAPSTTTTSTTTTSTTAPVTTEVVPSSEVPIVSTEAPEVAAPEVVAPEVVAPEVAAPEVVGPETVGPEAVVTVSPPLPGAEEFARLLQLFK